MSRRTIIAAVILALIGLGLWLYLRPRHDAGGDLFTGYVVSRNVFMTSPVAGTLSDVSVKRGDRVTAGAALFRVDPTVREAATEQARAVIAANRAQLGEQQAALSRSKADLGAAGADVTRYGDELKRLEAAEREKAGSVARLQIEQTRAALQAAEGRRDAAKAGIGSAEAAIAAREAQVKQAEAGLTSAKRELSDLSPPSPVAGRVEDVMFKPGESVTANTPIVSIIPDGEVKVRFYVPQGRVSDFQPGRKLFVGCDGCASGMTATVDFVAREPEYTPPVIYSLSAREKLVFMVEAVPTDPRALIPGQPMDVAADAALLPAR